MRKLFFVLILLILVSTLTAAADSWTPPIGIPVPSFGVEETYRMYDETSARNRALVYQTSESGGYFTHYVDVTDPAATDSKNSYGSIKKPRKTIPWNLPQGSVVEIHGGPYSPTSGYSKYWTWFSGRGTESQPIFIRGVDMPEFNGMRVRVGGTYLIIEGLNCNDSTFSFHHEYSGAVWEHIVIRNNEMHHYTGSSASAIGCGKGKDTVIYNNHIHHNGNVPYRDDSDVHGIYVNDYAERVWIIDNTIHHQDGDSIQINANGGSHAVSGEWPQYVYIGRNTMYADRENAVDLKDSDHVIISQNEIYGYTTEDRVFGIIEEPRPVHGSDGTPLVLANEGAKNVWALFNNVHDSIHSIRASDEYTDPKPNIYLIGNLIHNINGFGVITWRKHNINLLLNTFYNVGVPFWSNRGSDGNEGLAIYNFYNNIFAVQNGVTYDSRFYDFYIYVGNRLAALSSSVENNLFFGGNGFTWGRNREYSTLTSFAAMESEHVQNCIEADPLFVDPENNNFNLQEASPVNNIATSSKVQVIFDLFYELYGIRLSEDIEGVPRTTEVDNDSIDTDTTSSSTGNNPARVEPETQTGTSNNQNSSTSSAGNSSRIQAQESQTGESDTTDSNSEEMRIITGRSAYIQKIFERFESLYSGNNRVGTIKEYFE